MTNYIYTEILTHYGLYIMLISMALMTIGADHPVIALFCLVVVFMDVGAIYITLGMEFLAFSYIIVYVGAIAILFLFVIMMLNIKINLLLENNIRYLPMGSILGFILFIELSAMVDYKYILLLLFTPIKALLYYLNIIPLCSHVYNSLLSHEILSSFSSAGIFYNFFSINLNELNPIINSYTGTGNGSNSNITPEVINSLKPIFTYDFKQIAIDPSMVNGMKNIPNFDMEAYKALIYPARVDIIIDNLGNIVTSNPVRDAAGNIVNFIQVLDSSNHPSFYFPMKDSQGNILISQIIKDQAGNIMTLQIFKNDIGNIIGVQTIFDTLGNIVSILPQLNIDINHYANINKEFNDSIAVTTIFFDNPEMDETTILIVSAIIAIVSGSLIGFYLC